MDRNSDVVTFQETVVKHTVAGVTLKLRKTVPAFWKHLFVDVQTGSIKLHS